MHLLTMPNFFLVLYINFNGFEQTFSKIAKTDTDKVRAICFHARKQSKSANLLAGCVISQRLN